MFEFITRFKKNNNKNIESMIPESLSPVTNDFEKYLERIRILENKNIILSRKVELFEKKSIEYENKYNSLLKASKEEINRITDARKLLQSDSNYQKDLQQLGLVSQEEHIKVSIKCRELEEEYLSIKKDYEILSRKLNNILTENL